MQNVAIYIRWSTEDQGEGTTLDVQRDACRAYVESQGWTHRPDLLFVDDGVSGATMDRPALARLRARVQAREIQCVVVYKLDRLSRSVLDMVKLVLEEWDGLCAIKSAREPIDTLTPTGRMFFYQLMSFAEWERAVIRDRMFAGRVRRAQEGKMPGFVLPYGYTKDAAGRIVADPAAAAAVQRIFRLYLSGMGVRAVGQALDRDGIRAPAGGRWSPPTLHRILTNPCYTGRLVYGRTTSKGTPLAVREGFFPVIVTEQDFAAVQALRTRRPGVGRPGAGTGRSLASRPLLTGILRCQCGRACSGVSFGSRGATYRYYACAGAQNGQCEAGHIRQDALDQAVVQHLLELLQTGRVSEMLLSHMVGDHKRRAREAKAAREAAERELRRLEESERRVRGLLIDGRLDPDEYRKVQAELAARLAGAREHLEKARQDHESARAALADHTSPDRHPDGWDALTIAEQKELLRRFVRSVTARRDRDSGELACEVTWHLANPA